MGRAFPWFREVHTMPLNFNFLQEVKNFFTTEITENTEKGKR